MVLEEYQRTWQMSSQMGEGMFNQKDSGLEY